MHPRPARAAVLAAALPLVLLGTACGPGDAAPEATGADAPGAAAVATSPAPRPTLDHARDLGVEKAAEPLPGLLTAAQPDPEQLDALAAAGYTTAISLRPTSEDGAGWEEGSEVTAGLDFHRLPVEAPGGLDRETVEELDRLLAEARGEPTVLYCGSSNRVGALLALRAHWLQGMDPEEALELGRRAGLEKLEPAVAEIMGLADGR